MASLGDDLLGIVNKLQDLVFNTIGNDSLDLPQIVSSPHYVASLSILGQGFSGFCHGYDNFILSTFLNI